MSGAGADDVDDTQTLSATRRPLTETEKRLLRSRIRNVTARARHATAAALPITGGGVLVLWLWTLLASDVTWVIVTAFWLIVGAGLALWVRRDMRLHSSGFDAVSKDLESALRRNAADVYDVRAVAFAELEEIEDEGACYAFEMNDGRIVFIQGQEFYESARFPSLDFSVVYVLDEDGRAVDVLIDKRGAKAPPARRIPAAVKEQLDVPNHLDGRRGSLTDLEGVIGTTWTDRRA